MSTLDKIKHPVDNELQIFNKKFKQSMKSDVPLLGIITNYMLKHKGKQIRPLLVFLSAKMNGDIQDNTYTAASLIEMLHTASLIHDDVVDDSYERRGIFSINALWKSKIAVLVGDYLLSKGLLLSLDHKAYDLLHTVSDAVREMSEGEILQIKNSRKSVITTEQYLEVIEKKTASLLAACTKSGAQSVGASSEDNEKMHLLGLYAGMAFQIRDDLFDYETNYKMGKPLGNDIKEKKITLPLISALNNTDKKTRNKIYKSYKHHNKDRKKVNRIIEFVKQNGGIDESYDKMKSYIKEAKSILNTFPDSDAKNSMVLLLNYIIIRNK